MSFLIQHRAALPGLLLLGSGGALLAALFFQYGMDLAPCALCYDQRYAHMAALLPAAAAFFATGKLRAALLFLAALALFAGAGIAGYHVGVEQAWWSGPTGCSAPALEGLDLQELRAALEATPVVRCDEVAWSLMGISMAGYNLLLSLALGFMAVAGGIADWRRTA